MVDVNPEHTPWRGTIDGPQPIETHPPFEGEVATLVDCADGIARSLSRLATAAEAYVALERDRRIPEGERDTPAGKPRDTGLPGVGLADLLLGAADALLGKPKPDPFAAATAEKPQAPRGGVQYERPASDDVLDPITPAGCTWPLVLRTDARGWLTLTCQGGVGGSRVFTFAHRAGEDIPYAEVQDAVDRHRRVCERAR